MYRRKAKTRYVPNQESTDYVGSNYELEQQEYQLQQQGNEIDVPATDTPPERPAVQKRASTHQRPLQKKNDTRRKENHLSYYAYGKSAAIEFVCDETKKHRIATIAIQAASAKEGERGYAWDDKTVIQVPRNELLQIAAIMMGKLERAEFRHSTQYTSKSYVVEHQGGKIFFMVSEKGKAIRAVGLSPDDTYQVTTLVLRQLKSNAPWMSVAEIIEVIERTVVQMRQYADDSVDSEADDDDYDHSENSFEDEEEYEPVSLGDEPIELVAGDEELLNDPPQYVELKY